MKLGVLDLGIVAPGESPAQRLRDMVDTAVQLDRLGYSRIWFGEHHRPRYAHGCPEMLSTLAATRTRRIRIGAAGVLLYFYSPLKVAEVFRTMALLFSERIDLGLASGVTNEEARQLLVDGFDLQAAIESREFAAKVRELIRYYREPAPPDSPFQGFPLRPGDPAPPVYLLGSLHNARLAAELGTAFAYSLIHGIPKDGLRIIPEYQQNFQPSLQLERPYTLLASNFLCMESDAEAAAYIYRMGTGGGSVSFVRNVKMGGINVVGSPRRCRKQIEVLLERFQCDEFVLIPFYDSHQARVRGFELLAEEVGLVDCSQLAAPGSSA